MVNIKQSDSPNFNPAVVRSRLADYMRADPVEERKKLIALWREAHPECVSQPPSAKHRPLMMIGKRAPGDLPEEPDETWANDISVTLRRKPDHVFGKREGMIQLGINTLDGTARHDWREFQGIKNQLAGEECEAFELYPAESRLLDPSNYYSLWCFPGVRRIKVGKDGPRETLDADEALAPQRGFE